MGRLRRFGRGWGSKEMGGRGRRISFTVLKFHLCGRNDWG